MKTRIDRRKLSESLWTMAEAFRVVDWRDDRTRYVVYDNILHDFDQHCMGWSDKSLLESYQDAVHQLLKIMGREVFGQLEIVIYDRISSPFTSPQDHYRYVITPNYGDGDSD